MTCGSTGCALFFVRGLPIAQGSMRAWIAGGKPILTSTAKGLPAWRRLIADQAQAHAPPVPWDRGVSVHATFYVPRPKSDPKRRRTYPDRKPDIDKCARAVLDALTHVFWTDDARVLVLHAEKRFADDPFVDQSDRKPPGVLIEAWPVENGGPP